MVSTLGHNEYLPSDNSASIPKDTILGTKQSHQGTMAADFKPEIKKDILIVRMVFLLSLLAVMLIIDETLIILY